MCVGLVSSNEDGTPVRPTFKNLYKWPESDAEFLKSVMNGGVEVGQRKSPEMNSYSSRQLFLRSYPFTRRENVLEKTKRCIGIRRTDHQTKKEVVRGTKKGLKDCCSTVLHGLFMGRWCNCVRVD